jgi:hypothetical protein
MSYRGTLSFEEKGNSLFHIDPLLPIEFVETVKRRTCQDPERSLMLAVLQDAITCLEKYREFGSGENKILFDEAKDWVLSDDWDWLFSFNNICDAVGLDVGCLRAGLKPMTERRQALPVARKTAKSDQRAGQGAPGKTYVTADAVRRVRLSPH